MNAQLVTRRGYPEVLIWWLVGAKVLDVAITLPYWHLEGNPVVLALGRPLFVGISLGAVLGAAYLWFDCRLWRSRIAVACVASIAALTSLAVVTNVLVVAGVL